MSSERVRIEVVYAAGPACQAVVALECDAPCTVEAAIRASGLLARFPEIDLARQAVGIYGRRVALSDTVHDGDRVEIYRPLAADPKETRRRRARAREERRKKAERT
jgi:putative ubiquitin-RnfH superfamily antitoxin RatB of RatAB toxin-antitoxin module